ncbi:MAG: hypothetical protein R2942_00905 [Ignavibacteria bacterium]|nr:hypothetical protein [Ignavibacteriota bacterium]
MKKIKKTDEFQNKIQKERKLVWRYHDLFLPPQILFFEDEYPAIINNSRFKEKIKSDKISKK